MPELAWSTLCAAVMFATATSITPGPNNTMLLASGVNFGWVRTLPHLLGVSGGLMFILLLGALGVQQWLFQVHGLHALMQGLGALYLVYLAWRLFNAGASSPAGAAAAAKPMTFMQAAVFQWVNPKVWAMVFGFFSAYVPAQATATEVVVLCLVFTVVNLPCVGLWALAGHRLNHWLRAGQRMMWFNRGMAALLLGSVLAAFAGA